jgi:hypothetical protein
VRQNSKNCPPAGATFSGTIDETPIVSRSDTRISHLVLLSGTQARSETSAGEAAADSLAKLINQGDRLEGLTRSIKAGSYQTFRNSLLRGIELFDAEIRMVKPITNR